MDTNREKIDKIYEFNKRVQELVITESDLYKKAMVNADALHKIKRDGKQVEVNEETLFEEIRISGLKSQAGELLKNKYEELFIVAKKREKTDQEMQAYIIEAFGFDFRSMRIAEYLKLTEAVFDAKMSELKK